MSSNKEIRVGGKSYQTIKDTAKRYDKDKEKPVVTTNLVDKQRRKLDNLMARIDKPINLPERVRLRHYNNKLVVLLKLLLRYRCW